MTEKNNDMSDVVDLSVVYERLGNWSKNVLLIVLYFFLRNIFRFILFVLLSVIAGFLYFQVSEPYYKSELFGYSHTISNIEVIQYLNNWNYEKEFTEVELDNIKNISAQYLHDLNKDGNWDLVEEFTEDPVTDTAIINKRLFGAFCIHVELYDTAMLGSIKTKIFHYLESKKRVQDIQEIRWVQQQALIKKIQKEMSDLEAFKNQQYFQALQTKDAKTGDVLILNEREVRLYHSQIITLYQEKQSIERTLFLSPRPFEITQDFTAPMVPENSLDKILFSSMFYGLIFGFFLILFIDRKKQISRLFLESK